MAQLDSKSISEIISKGTIQIISDTEKFVESVADVPLGEDTVTMMINGKSSTINKSDYDRLQEVNNRTKAGMKAKIKAITDEFKAKGKENTLKE